MSKGDIKEKQRATNQETDSTTENMQRGWGVQDGGKQVTGVQEASAVMSTDWCAGEMSHCIVRRKPVSHCMLTVLELK